MPRKSIPIGVATFLILVFSSCTCIYFNTFHNIRKNFNAAEKSRSDSNRDEARGSEVKQYQDAITKASRVLERHPTSSWVDDALYVIGTSYYYLGEYDKATRKFRELFANYPESEYVPRARLLMAKAKLKVMEEAEAVIIFEDVFEGEKSKSMKAEAARVLGEYYFENKDYEKANEYFMSLIDSLGDEKTRLNALIFVADGYFDMFSFARAVENYEAAIEQNPDTLQYYHIKFRLAECDFFRNRISEGLDKLAALADNELYYDSLAPIRLKMAEGYEWEGDFNSAVDTYEQIIVENPRRNPGAVAYYRMGLIYQYDFEDLEQARIYFQKSREEFAQSSIAEDATRRASKLALLEQYSHGEETEISADSIQQLDQRQLDALSEDQFLLGELFYFDLEKPDSAITAFETLLDRYPESRYAPRALMTIAYIHRDEYRDSAAADSILRRVMTSYPRYDEAEEVIHLLGLAGTVADSGYAAIQFGRAVEYLEKFQELDSSMYYMNLSVDSILAADSAAAADSLASDTAEVPDSLQAPDSMIVEDTYLIADTGLAPDSQMAPQASADTTIPEKQPQISGAELLARERQMADSIRLADSVKVADSIRAAELARMADSLRAARREQARESGETEMDSTPQSPPDTTIFSDTLSLAEMVAMAHDASQTEDAAVDTTAAGDVEKTTADTLAADTLGADTLGEDTFVGVMGPPLPPAEPAQIVGPTRPSESTALSQPGSLLDSLRQQALEGGARPRAQADSAALVGNSTSERISVSAPAADSARPVDLPQATDTGSKTADLTADTTQASDSVEIFRKDLIEYWREAYLTAQNRYSDTLLALLDSAAFYYAYIIDSFPHSRYSIQSRYSLLWTYDRFLTPGDSILLDLYRGFVDSFPESEYAEAIAEEYNIRSATMPSRQRQQQQQQQQQDAAVEDTAQSVFATDTLSGAEDSLPSDVPLVDSKYIKGDDGKILEPAKKYFLQEDVPFQYPLDALAYNIEGDLYFQIQINPFGEVVDHRFMNPTRSEELNEKVTETVKNTRFDAGRIDPKLYDTWFYYVYEVRIPQNLRQR